MHICMWMYRSIPFRFLYYYLFLLNEQCVMVVMASNKSKTKNVSSHKSVIQKGQELPSSWTKQYCSLDCGKEHANITGGSKVRCDDHNDDNDGHRVCIIHLFRLRNFVIIIISHIIHRVMCNSTNKTFSLTLGMPYNNSCSININLCNKIFFCYVE